MDTLSTKTPGLEEVAGMVEAEWPKAAWLAGRCRCGDPAGDYAASILSDDYAQGVAMMPQGLVQVTQGWCVHVHARTAADALGMAYGRAMGEGRS